MTRSRTHQFAAPDVATYMDECSQGDHEDCPGDVRRPDLGASAIVICRCPCHRLDFAPWPWPTGEGSGEVADGLALQERTP